MDNKRIPRLRRALATRRKITNLRQVSLCVYRSNSHIYVQVYSPQRNQVLTQASSAEKNLRGGKSGNVEAARKVGELIAQRCLEKGITQAVFDRSGYKYHGRVKALAEAAREKGLKI